MAVINHTGLDGKYDFTLMWDANNPETLGEALPKQMGLFLVSKTSEMSVLMVE